MRALAITAIIFALGLSTGAVANHKPGHHVPPGQLRKHAVVATEAPSAVPRDDRWAPYVDDRFGFSIDLPFGMFEEVEKTKRGIRLRSANFGATIDVYASEDAEGFDPQQFAAAIEDADRVREVTYRAGGKTWFVLSGFYSRTDAGDAIIFYTKFMFSADRSRLAAFEISFPAREKPRFADAVERIEDSFSGPSP